MLERPVEDLALRWLQPRSSGTESMKILLKKAKESKETRVESTGRASTSRSIIQS